LKFSETTGVIGPLSAISVRLELTVPFWKPILDGIHFGKIEYIEGKMSGQKSSPSKKHLRRINMKDVNQPADCNEKGIGFSSQIRLLTEKEVAIH